MTFLRVLRLIVHIVWSVFFMGYSAYQTIFEEEYWHIMMFFIFLFLFIMAIKEFKEGKPVGKA